MSYQEFSEMFKNFNGTLYLYISGSQGVSPNEMKVKYGVDFNSLEDLENLFSEFIDENAYDNLDSYLEDCDGDEYEAMGEAIADSGQFLLGTSLDNLTHEYNGFISEIILL